MQGAGWDKLGWWEVGGRRSIRGGRAMGKGATCGTVETLSEMEGKETPPPAPIPMEMSMDNVWRCIPA